MKDLKSKTIRGGAARIVAQVTTFAVRIGSLMILARLLGPKDFGLVGMVTAFTGILNLFRDFGLSTATVQRANVTDEQLSTLFWINSLVGVVLGVVAVALAPALALFYHEPRLLWEPSFSRPDFYSMPAACNTRLFCNGRCASPRWA